MGRAYDIALIRRDALGETATHIGTRHHTTATHADERLPTKRPPSGVLSGANRTADGDPTGNGDPAAERPGGSWQDNVPGPLSAPRPLAGKRSPKLARVEALRSVSTTGDSFRTHGGRREPYFWVTARLHPCGTVGRIARPPMRTRIGYRSVGE